MRGSRLASALALCVLVCLAVPACGPRKAAHAPTLSAIVVEGGHFTEIDRGLRSGDRTSLPAGPHMIEVAFDVRGTQLGPGVGDDWSATVGCQIEMRTQPGRRYTIRLRRRTDAGWQGPKDALYGAEIVDDRGWKAPGIARCAWSAAPSRRTGASGG